jgi:RNA polymerase sigma factor (sigma-70 family)
VTLRTLEDGPAGRSRRRWWPAGQSDVAPDAAEVYRALAPAVLGYLRSQRAAEPEDLLGEVFLQVVRDLPRFRGDDDALRRWVFTIAYHRLVDARRRSGRRPALDDGPLPELCSAPPADLLDPDLVRALSELTAEQREVVALRFVADLSIDAVATLTGRSKGAVNALQHRALAALAEQLGGTGRAPNSAATEFSHDSQLAAAESGIEEVLPPPQFFTAAANRTGVNGAQ